MAGVLPLKEHPHSGWLKTSEHFGKNLVCCEKYPQVIINQTHIRRKKKTGVYSHDVLLNHKQTYQ